MTAKEFLRNMDISSVSLNGQKFYTKESLEEAMIEFAKYHVQKALEAASETYLSADNDEEAFDKMGEVMFSEEALEYNKNELLTCYSLENIK